MVGAWSGLGRAAALSSPLAEGGEKVMDILPGVPAITLVSPH